MGIEKESNVKATPELTDFKISYCALTEHMMLHACLGETMVDGLIHVAQSTLCRCTAYNEYGMIAHTLLS